MQYPVPQFTDVEDKIIGPLTIKQFGIIFGAGIIIFLSYSLTKSLAVAIFFVILVGLPAAGIAFVKINGRYLYNAFPIFLKYFAGPKYLVFHKEAINISDNSKVKDVEVKPQVEEKKEVADPKTRLKEINRLLQEKEREERELAKKIT